MSFIERLEDHVVYENPRPHVHSRHAFFPGLVQFPSGGIVGLAVIGEAFEAPNLTTHVLRSKDRGRTWQLQGPLYDKRLDPFPISDFLKPVLLQDGTLVALGYRFFRHDTEAPIGIPETDGIQPGDQVVCFSRDQGWTWTPPRVFPRSTPELIEIPSRGTQLHNGDIVATGGVFKMPDGANPSGQFGVLLRSKDGGHTWDDSARFFEMPSKTVTAYESHLVEMQPGRLVAICWAINLQNHRMLPNMVTTSHDNGYTWSEPIDTRHMGEAANLLWLGGEKLLSIHCHRGEESALYVRLIDFSNDRWKMLEEKIIWGGRIGRQTSEGQSFSDVAKSLRFGQASLLKLDNDEILATHWAVEEGQGKILTHRLRMRG